MADNILEVKHLKKYFKTSRGMLHAVDDINFTLERGKTLWIQRRERVLEDDLHILAHVAHLGL